MPDTPPPEPPPEDPTDSPPEDPQEPSPEDRDEILKRRHRRQKILRGKHRSRFSDIQQWVFVGLALLFVLAWLVGREACTRKITDTYGTLTRRSARDAGTADAASPSEMAPNRPGMKRAPSDSTDDGW